MADSDALHGEGHDGGLAGPVAGGARLHRDGQARADHLEIVDPSPQVATIRHVAVLTLHALASEAARLPLVERVLERLAVQREAPGTELMAAPAELGGKKRQGAD